MLLAFGRGEQRDPDFRPYSGRPGGHTARDTQPTDAHMMLLRTTSKSCFVLSSPELTLGQKRQLWDEGLRKA